MGKKLVRDVREIRTDTANVFRYASDTLSHPGAMLLKHDKDAIHELPASIHDDEREQVRHIKLRN
jgi:hypothetical protein